MCRYASETSILSASRFTEDRLVAGLRQDPLRQLTLFAIPSSWSYGEGKETEETGGIWERMECRADRSSVTCVIHCQHAKR